MNSMDGLAQQMTLAEETQKLPYLGWNLMLHPPQLSDAYWQQRCMSFRHWDKAVVKTMCLIAIASWWQWLFHRGLYPACAVFVPSLILLLLWLWATSQQFYDSKRLLAVTLGRLMLMLFSAVSLDEGADMVSHVLIFEGHECATLIGKIILLGHLLTHPFQMIGLQMPWQWQLVHHVNLTLLLLTRNVIHELVQFGLSLQGNYVKAAEFMLALYREVLQNGMHYGLPKHNKLQGRTCNIWLLATVVHFSCGGVLLWVCYMFQWSDIRHWLRRKVAPGDNGQGMLGNMLHNTPGQQVSGTVEMNGVRLHKQHLHNIIESPGAHMLLDWRYGRLLTCAVHAVVVGFICRTALLLSQLIVWQILPRLGSPKMLDRYCPVMPAPAVAA